MSCAPFQELLTASLDDELSAEEQVQLEQHLLDCSACRSLQQQLKRMESGFAHLPERTPPPLKSRPAAISLPAKGNSAVGVTTAWLALLAAAACAAVSFWSPTGFRPKGSELYLCANQLQHTHPQQEALAVTEFRSPPLSGRAVVSGQLAFEIHLDSDSQACKNLQLEVDYDFDGDGKIDRSETYASFNTDDRDGWEIYTHQHGPFSQQGEMRDFTGGTVACRLKNASGKVQVLQGHSKLILPHEITV